MIKRRINREMVDEYLGRRYGEKWYDKIARKEVFIPWDDSWRYIQENYPDKYRELQSVWHKQRRIVVKPFQEEMDDTGVLVRRGDISHEEANRRYDDTQRRLDKLTEEFISSVIVRV